MSKNTPVKHIQFHLKPLLVASLVAFWFLLHPHNAHAADTSGAKLPAQFEVYKRVLFFPFPTMIVPLLGQEKPEGFIGFQFLVETSSLTASAAVCQNITKLYDALYTDFYAVCHILHMVQETPDPVELRLRFLRLCNNFFKGSPLIRDIIIDTLFVKKPGQAPQDLLDDAVRSP